MNANDILKYGHLWVMKHVEGFSESEWITPGVCGYWSVKEIINHLASFECVLVEVSSSFLEGGSTSTLDQFRSLHGDEFNAVQVGKRKDLSIAESLEEYSNQQAKSRALIGRIPEETLRKPGTIPWYGREYSLDDYIVYAFYGHKREHMAQVAVYRDKLGR